MTDVDRRDFLIGAGFATAGAAVPTEASAIARPPKEMPPQAVGMLYDSTLCIGCKACVAACKAANKMPADIPATLSGWNEYTWDSAEDLSGRTLNVIKVYRNGTVEQKDRETNGYAFVKRHCLHCVDPSCVSVCPVSAMKKDPVTGRDVPDETKRVPLLTYKNPRPAEWPTAHYIVGNPPFLGPARMREALGDGYAETLREAYPAVPESTDFVMYWWHKAAELVRAGKVSRFGFITTNSLRQTFARRVVEAQIVGSPPLSLLFAIPDHP